MDKKKQKEISAFYKKWNVGEAKVTTTKQDSKIIRLDDVRKMRVKKEKK